MNVPEELRLLLLVTIVERGKAAGIVNLYREEKLHFDYVCMSLGTATSQILDYFGLAATEMDLVLTLAPRFKIKRVMQKADEKLMLHKPGHGILFTIPLSGVSSHLPKLLCKADDVPDTFFTMESEEKKMDHPEIRYDLVLAIVNSGNVDLVMDAAREAGARGGTMLHARRVGFEDVENLLGFTLQPEKDIVTILTPRSQKQQIRMASSHAAGLSTEARGILFSLPVEDMIGLQPPVADEKQ